MTLETRTLTEVGIFNPPEVVLENARTAARALADVISKKKKPVIMNGEQYLEMEDWELCGQFYGYTVRTHHAGAVEIDGVKGARAEADLVDIRTGEIIGGAEAYCMRDEEHWNTRPKYEWQGEGKDRKRVKVDDEVVPWFQLASMAQTRAGAKAFRNRLAWVVVLAGYRPTPAEEMTEGTISEAVQERRTVNKTSHYCPVHNVNFFKKGRMKGYAHPIDGTEEWCNEPEPSLQPTKSTRSPVAEETNGNLPEEEIGATPTVLTQIKEDMTRANWTPLSVVSWIRSKANYQGLNLAGKFDDIINRMNPEQVQFLQKEIAERLEMR